MSSGNDYVIVVEANDGEGGIGTFNVTVTVTNVDETPEITSKNPAHTFPEIEYDYVHVAADLNVATFTARDEEDGTGIIWTVSGTDGGHFTISTGLTSGEGVLFFRIRPDFEEPDDDGDRQCVQHHREGDRHYVAYPGLRRHRDRGRT